MLGVVGFGAAATRAAFSAGVRFEGRTGDALAMGSLVRRAAHRVPRPAVPTEATEAPRPVVRPTGAPAGLSCAEARAIVAQVERSLAGPLPPVPPRDFGRAVADWLDPHGLWSAAPDATPGRAIAERAARLLEEVTLGDGRCAAAEEVGRELETWVGEVRAELASIAREPQHPVGPGSTFLALSATPFEDGEVTKEAAALSRRLGETLALGRAGYGPNLTRYTEAAIDRFAPPFPASVWSEVVLVAAVRAFVPLVDPHGAWAPEDELLSIYDVGLEGDPPSSLWAEMTRTAIGVRIDRGALPPLEDGDLVLAVEGTAAAGLSVEQANQLAVIARGTQAEVVFLRAGEAAPRSTRVGAEIRPPVGLGAPGSTVPRVVQVAYGSREVTLVSIPDVPDDLGDVVENALSAAMRRSSLGVVLDLRGNGGGSTDGALEALAPFLPGAPLFPMRRRDGSIEVDRAPLPIGPAWSGPVATLVDEETASAAEMIAAALAAYGRGTIVGRRTYGKGCAQEYLDDDAGAGLLRLTTLVFSGPDGRPLQRVGVTPNILLGSPEVVQREDSLPHALAPWTGPDVRALEFPRPAWPSHGGRVGPCADPEVCHALLAIGSVRAAAR